jgi:hypothetical protein
VLEASLGAVPGVAEASLREEGETLRCTVTLQDGVEQREVSERLARAVLAVGELRELQPVRTDLEALFRTLTASPNTAGGEGT